MFIDESELSRRVNRDDNLLNKLRKTPSHKGRVVPVEDGRGRKEGDKNIPPIVREIVGTLAHYDSRTSVADSFGVSPVQVTNYKNGHVSPQRGDDDEANQRLARAIEKNLSKVRDVALDKLVMTLGAITPEKIALTTKVKDLAAIASNLSSVVDKSMPLALRKQQIQNEAKAGVQFQIYAPNLKKEDEFETVKINGGTQ